MSDYIKREDALECVTYDEEYTTEQIKGLPSADVAPVRYGRWIKEYRAKGQVACMCTECCGETGRCTNYCPNCGAKMDAQREE